MADAAPGDPTPRQRQRCTNCGRKTRSVARICLECKPAPAVSRDGAVVHVEGIGPLSTHAALQLAHRLADAVTP
jgi:hypothetical protein